MKKLLLSIILGSIFIGAFSQSHIQFLDQEQASKACGDSCYIGLTDSHTGSDTFCISILSNNFTDTVILRMLIVSDIIYFPQYTAWGQQAHKIGIKIPSNLSGYCYLRVYPFHYLGNPQVDYSNNAGQAYQISCVNDVEKFNNSSELISTQYFNLIGQPVSSPISITVEVSTYIDGSKRVRKIISE